MKRHQTRRGFLRSRFFKDAARVVAVGCCVLLIWVFTVILTTTF